MSAFICWSALTFVFLSLYLCWTLLSVHFSTFQVSPVVQSIYVFNFKQHFCQFFLTSDQCFNCSFDQSICISIILSICLPINHTGGLSVILLFKVSFSALVCQSIALLVFLVKSVCHWINLSVYLISFLIYLTSFQFYLILFLLISVFLEITHYIFIFKYIYHLLNLLFIYLLGNSPEVCTCPNG